VKRVCGASSMSVHCRHKAQQRGRGIRVTNTKPA
jgi:hypothetical protein